MEYKMDSYLTKESSNPSKKDISAMKMWLETGCVKQSYLEEVLGDQSIAICVLPKQ